MANSHWSLRGSSEGLESCVLERRRPRSSLVCTFRPKGRFTSEHEILEEREGNTIPGRVNLSWFGFYMDVGRWLEQLEGLDGRTAFAGRSFRAAFARGFGWHIQRRCRRIGLLELFVSCYSAIRRVQQGPYPGVHFVRWSQRSSSFSATTTALCA
jgi:hypothetical protein